MVHTLLFLNLSFLGLYGIYYINSVSLSSNTRSPGIFRIINMGGWGLSPPQKNRKLVFTVFSFFGSTYSSTTSPTYTTPSFVYFNNGTTRLQPYQLLYYANLPPLVHNMSIPFLIPFNYQLLLISYLLSSLLIDFTPQTAENVPIVPPASSYRPLPALVNSFL